MRAKDIIEDKIYKLKDSGNYPNIRVIKVLKPNQDENTKKYIVVKVEHYSHFGKITKRSTGAIRYYKPSQIEKSDIKISEEIQHNSFNILVDEVLNN